MNKGKNFSMSKKLFQIFYHFGKQMTIKNISSFAASTAFFLFISLIPILYLVCSILPYVNITQETLRQSIDAVLPGVIGVFLNSIIADVYGRSAGGISLAVLVMLWSAGKGMMALMRGLNAVNEVEEKKGYIYVDTGAMYRAMALYFIEQGISASAQGKISAAAAEVEVTITYENNEQIVWLNGRNVNGLIRTEEVGKMASASSGNKEVRKKLVELQQALAKKENVVMDGRDIGTCVLPDANVKVYLTADSRVRAVRRYEELKAKGQECDLDVIEKDIIDRDYQDMHRELSPLMQAEDAVLVDSSKLTIEQGADAIIDLCDKGAE